MSDWVARLSEGDQSAAQPLWERYFHRLVLLARSRMTSRRAVADEEDVALSAFDSFCRGASAGRYPRLDDADNLWSLLVVIVCRKAHDYVRREQRLKRGGSEAQPVEVNWAELLCADPTPAFAAEVADQCEQLLTCLGEESLRSVAVWKMEGFTTEEIAGKLNCALRTVERKLRLIRDIWSKSEERQAGP